MTNTTLTDSPPAWLSKKNEVDFVHRTLLTLGNAWTRQSPNLSGMRAAFRRWKPGQEQAPTLSMRQYVWGWIGSPYAEKDAEGNRTNPVVEDRRLESSELMVIDRAAVLTAMRAIAGDHEGTNSIGSALYRAGVAEKRLVELLTTNRPQRAEALHRILRYVAKEPAAAIGWSRREVGTILDYLYGDDRTAQRAANSWAADYYRLRGKVAAADTEKESENES